MIRLHLLHLHMWSMEIMEERTAGARCSVQRVLFSSRFWSCVFTATTMRAEHTPIPYIFYIMTYSS